MVSIHAPARGATQYRGGGAEGNLVSIHAPARGATREAGFSDRDVSVSIHAPARGATHGHLIERNMERGFNPRSREGSDAVNLPRMFTRIQFQSTLPRGERLYDVRNQHVF